MKTKENSEILKITKEVNSLRKIKGNLETELEMLQEGKKVHSVPQNVVELEVEISGANTRFQKIINQITNFGNGINQESNCF